MALFGTPRVVNRVVIPPTYEREPQPDLDDVLQDGIPANPAIAVVVEGTVSTQELPATTSTSRSVNIGIATGGNVEQLFGKDRRRKAVTFWTENNGVYFGENPGAVSSRTGAHLPTGGSFTINHTDSIYMGSDNAAGSFVSYVMEQWAD